MNRYFFPCGMSRSGTTLLTTILDSHPDISMGYELLPADLASPERLIELIDEAMAQPSFDEDKCGRYIRELGFANMGKFVARCHRCSVPPEELKVVLETFRGLNERQINTFDNRCKLALAVATRKMEKEQTNHCGFKVNFSAFEQFYKLIGGGYYVYIMRDPRDVVASHFENGFDRSVETITEAWNVYAKLFDKFSAAHPKNTAMVRYEDLVSQPAQELERVMGCFGMSLPDEMLNFFDSKASVHKTAHPNSDNLKKDFFTTSVSRWQNDLDKQQIRLIDNRCGKLMSTHGYAVAA